MTYIPLTLCHHYRLPKCLDSCNDFIFGFWLDFPPDVFRVLLGFISGDSGVVDSLLCRISCQLGAVFRVIDLDQAMTIWIDILTLINVRRFDLKIDINKRAFIFFLKMHKPILPRWLMPAQT